MKPIDGRPAALPELQGREPARLDAQPARPAEVGRLHHHQPDRGAGRDRRELGPLHPRAQSSRTRRPRPTSRPPRKSPASLRLRDLAGLIVIDFIDMEENRNDRAVERASRTASATTARASRSAASASFGLMEMTRQRIRASVLESTMKPCPHCGGTGHVRSNSSVALLVVRAIEEFLLKDSAQPHHRQDAGLDRALRAQPQARHAFRPRGALRPHHHHRDGQHGRRAALRDPARRHRREACRPAPIRMRCCRLSRSRTKTTR